MDICYKLNTSTEPMSCTKTEFTTNTRVFLEKVMDMHGKQTRRNCSSLSKPSYKRCMVTYFTSRTNFQKKVLKVMCFFV